MWELLNKWLLKLAKEETDLFCEGRQSNRLVSYLAKRLWRRSKFHVLGRIRWLLKAFQDEMVSGFMTYVYQVSTLFVTYCAVALSYLATFLKWDYNMYRASYINDWEDQNNTLK